MQLVTKNSLKAEDFKDKVVFWDLDGVLAPYRFNGHISCPEDYRTATEEEVEAGVFWNRLPSKHIQNIVKSIDAKQQICITQYVLEEESTDKLSWIHEHFKKIHRTILMCMEDAKAIVLSSHCEREGIDKKDVIVIDDDVKTLEQLETAGFDAWHVSSLMDFFED